MMLRSRSLAGAVQVLILNLALVCASVTLSSLTSISASNSIQGESHS